MSQQPHHYVYEVVLLDGSKAVHVTLEVFGDRKLFEGLREAEGREGVRKRLGQLHGEFGFGVRHEDRRGGQLLYDAAFLPIDQMGGHPIELGEGDVGFEENILEAFDGLRLGVDGVDEGAEGGRAILREALQYIGTGAREEEGVIRSDGKIDHLDRVVEGQMDIYPPIDADLHLDVFRSQPMIDLSYLMS